MTLLAWINFNALVFVLGIVTYVAYYQIRKRWPKSAKSKKKTKQIAILYDQALEEYLKS